MVTRKKIDLEKVQASLNKACPKCGGLISPAEVRRIDFERIECPACGERFAPGGKLIYEKSPAWVSVSSTGAEHSSSSLAT
jgi:ribosomal protein S27AE